MLIYFMANHILIKMSVQRMPDSSRNRNELQVKHLTVASSFACGRVCSIDCPFHRPSFSFNSSLFHNKHNKKFPLYLAFLCLFPAGFLAVKAKKEI